MPIHTQLDAQSPAKRRIIVAVAVADLAVRAWALADLAKRPQSQVRGFEGRLGRRARRL